MEQCTTQLERKLYQAYNSADAYRVTCQAEMLEQMNELTGATGFHLGSCFFSYPPKAGELFLS